MQSAVLFADKNLSLWSEVKSTVIFKKVIFIFENILKLTV